MDQKTVKKYILLVGGDQLSLACQQAILIGCLCHEAGIEAQKRIVLVPGLFHAKMADTHSILSTYFEKPNTGTRSPGGLTFHNQTLDCLPIVLSFLPIF